MESSPNGVGISRKSDGYILFANSRNADLFDIPNEELEGHFTTEFWADQAERDAFLAEFERTGHVIAREVQLRRGKDAMFWCLLSWESIRVSGEDCILWWAYDLTDRKRAEEAMKEAKERAEADAKARSDFIAVVSHEVRTPMNGVLGMARLLKETVLNEEQADSVETIIGSGEALITIINDLLDLSKLDADRLDIESLPFSLGHAVEQAGILMKPRAQEKGLAFSARVAADIPDVLVGDAHRLRQILLNLLSNAVKFTESGTVALSVDAGPRRGDEATLTFAISDTGRGIDPAALKKPFSPYTQGSVEVARKYGGTGLGLAICRRLADLMGGEITVDSVVDRGSTFLLTIPLRIATAEEAKQVPEIAPKISDAPAAAITARPLRVLQAEDNKTNRAVLERILTRVGHSVTTVENGAKALMAVEAEDFDVVLMDRHMPEMDGIEATRRIRALLGPAADVPIIAITAGASQDEIAACFDAGMNDCLIKPVDPNQVRALLDELAIETPVQQGSPTAAPQAAEEKEPGDTPIDLGQLSRNLGEEDRTVLFSILDIFLGEFPTLLDRMNTAIAERDPTATHHTAHAAKGAAANAAAPVLVGLLKTIQDDAHQQDWGRIETLARDVSTEHAKVVTFCAEGGQ